MIQYSKNARCNLNGCTVRFYIFTASGNEALAFSFNITVPSLPSTVRLSPVRTSFSKSQPSPTITGISRLFARIAECESDEPKAVRKPCALFSQNCIISLGRKSSVQIILFAPVAKSFALFAFCRKEWKRACRIYRECRRNVLSYNRHPLRRRFLKSCRM